MLGESKILLAGYFNEKSMPPPSAISFMDIFIGEKERIALKELGAKDEDLDNPYSYYLYYRDYKTGESSIEHRLFTPPILTCYDYSDKPMD